MKANRLDLNKNTTEEGGVDFDITSLTIHSDYNRQPWANDICILYLSVVEETRSNLHNLKYISIDETNGGSIGATKQRFTDTILNIFVDDIDYRNSLQGKVAAAGWGTLKEGVAKSSPRLMGLDMVITQKDECKTSLDFKMPPEEIICVIGENEGDTCQGDSGGKNGLHITLQYIQ